MRYSDVRCFTIVRCDIRSARRVESCSALRPAAYTHVLDLTLLSMRARVCVCSSSAARVGRRACASVRLRLDLDLAWSVVVREW